MAWDSHNTLQIRAWELGLQLQPCLWSPQPLESETHANHVLRRFAHTLVSEEHANTKCAGAPGVWVKKQGLHLPSLLLLFCVLCREVLPPRYHQAPLILLPSLIVSTSSSVAAVDPEGPGLHNRRRGCARAGKALLLARESARTDGGD